MMKYVILVLGAIICFCIGVDVLAAGPQTVSLPSGVGSVALQAKKSLSGIAQFVTAGSYVAGMAFAVGAITKFKAHKDNPTQVPISQGIALLFVAAALIFIPAVFKSVGGTLFTSGLVAGVSGITSF